MFRKLFGRNERAAPEARLATVRNITVGRTVALDPLAWRRLGDETRFALDRDVLDITAQGLVSLDGGQYVHRFYTDDHVMLGHGMVMYDALYAWCQWCQGETHQWPPAMPTA